MTSSKIRNRVAIIGAGLAGCEAAWQLSTRNIPVTLFEMRPHVQTPAHTTGHFSELVCSNSFKSRELSNAHGLLKAELKLAGSIIINSAEENAIPAGSALAVDRELFSRQIEARLRAKETIEFRNQEVKSVRELRREFDFIILACGPLVSDSLATSIQNLLDEHTLFFYDAIAPVVYADSIDMSVAFKASRYDKGESDYINCPFNKDEYERFVDDLLTAKKVPFREYEKRNHFEGCLPIEIMAERGVHTLAFGPLKPVGISRPSSTESYHAVLQLRQENREGTLYNCVGCQTRLTWPEQKRIFRKIPGLKNCEFARYGSMHRNTYVNAPETLTSTLELKGEKNIFLAGQITGVEGYTESTAMGVWAAIQLIRRLENQSPLVADPTTMIGALVNYLKRASRENFQPMNANFGLITPLPGKKIRNKREKRTRMADVALRTWRKQLEGIGWNSPLNCQV